MLRWLAGATVAVALLAGCGSSKPAAHTTAGQGDDHARADLRQAVTKIEQCYSDSGNQYPPGFTDNTGSVTLLCGPGSRTINLAAGDSITYKPSQKSFTIEVVSTSKRKYEYDSRTGKITQR